MAHRDVLIVSNAPLIREVFHDIFLTAGYECLLAADGREGIEMFQGWRPSLVVCDFNLASMTGLDLLQDVREEDPDAAVIVVCGEALKRSEEVVGFLDAERLRVACLELGAYALLQKPVSVNDLLLSAEGALYCRLMAQSQRSILEQRWAGVRPMAGLSELLASFGAVYSTPLRGSTPQPSGGRRFPTPPHVDARETATPEEPGIGPAGRPGGSRYWPGAGAQCRWCRLENRSGARSCWSCGLPLAVKPPARFVSSQLSTSGRR